MIEFESQNTGNGIKLIGSTTFIRSFCFPFCKTRFWITLTDFFHYSFSLVSGFRFVYLVKLRVPSKRKYSFQ